MAASIFTFFILLFHLQIIARTNSDILEEGEVIWHEKVRPRKIISDKEITTDENEDLEEYVIQTSKEKIHIVLEPQNEISSPDISIHNGDNVIKLNERVLKRCHYSGTFQNGKGRVVMDTCNGLNGVLIDKNNNIYFVEPVGDGWHNISMHNYKSTSGTTDRGHVIKEKPDRIRKSPTLRWNKAANTSNNKIKNTANFDVNAETKYIQTTFVVDHAFYKWWSGDIEKIFNYINAIANYANMLYIPAGFKIAVIRMDIWVDEDKIDMEGEFFKNFEDYNEYTLIEEQGWEHDYAQFLTRKGFGLAGSSFLGTLCRGASASTVYAWTSNPYKLAGTSAHELGHSIGLDHYRGKCHCPSKVPCVMTPTNSLIPITDFADCSIDEMRRICKRGYCSCLLDKPGKIFNGPKCGNGFVEKGEECDCGDPVTCRNKCCNPATCKLARNAQCAHGKCCSENCTYSKAGTPCRKSISVCDIVEKCSGEHYECPMDVALEDFSQCHNGSGFCYHSVCSLTLEDQCKRLWGKKGHFGDKVCYVDGKSVNQRGDRWGNCGYDAKEDLVACTPSDALCGKLTCYGKNLGRYVHPGHSRMTKVYYDSKKNCRVGTTHVSGIPDPTWTGEGTKCGDDKVCLNYKCLPVKDQISQHSCSGLCKFGVCTQTGLCYCHPGYSGPTCNVADETQKVGMVVYPKCYGKCNSGVCNVASEQCWCPAGRSCPDCKLIDPGNTVGQLCSKVESGKRSKRREAIDCGSLFSGIFIKHNCKKQLGDKKWGALKHLLANYRNQVVWKEMKSSAARITCKCARDAKRRGYKSFGIQFWGECWASESPANELKTTDSNTCNNPQYHPCSPNDNLCIGTEFSTGLYSIIG